LLGINYSTEIAIRQIAPTGCARKSLFKSPYR
jgi:hypothetical protein